MAYMKDATGRRLDSFEVGPKPPVASAPGIYDRRLNVYNLKQSHLRRTRVAAAKALAGTAFWQMSFVGDSITAGQGGPPGVAGWTDQLSKMLVAAGYGETGSGWASAYTNVADSRWTVGAGWASQGTQSTLMQNNTTANPLSFKSIKSGTSCHVYYYQSAGAAGTFTVAIDGGTPATVTPAGGDAIGTFSVTGLANTQHTISIVRTGTAAVNIAGVEVRSASAGLHTQNVAIGGAGTTTVSSTNGFGLCKMTATPWAADTVFLAIGTNDAVGGATTATLTTKLATIIGLLRTGNAPDIILINEPARSDGNISALAAAIYATADAFDLPVIDWMDRWGTYTAASSLYADAAHPNPAGTADFARSVMAVLGLTGSADFQTAAKVSTAVERARIKNDFGFMGDSITAGGDSASNMGLSWAAYAAVMSGQRIHYVVNAAVPGQTTNSMVPRLQADIIDKGVGTCVILGGTNDIQTGMTMAQWQANITSMVDMLNAAGVTPILGTIPPNNTSATWKPLITKYNAWLRRFAEDRGITVLDFYGVLTNPATADYITGLNQDLVHPGDAGYRVMAQHAIDVLTPILPNNRPLLAQDNIDTNNLAVNGLAITDSNADGLADNWKTFPATLPSGATTSLVTDAAVPGKLQRLTVSGTAATAGIGYYKTSGFAAGDRIAVAGRITKTSGLRVDITATTYGGTATQYRPLQNTSGAITNGIFYQEFVMPTGGNQVEVSVILQAGTGSVDIGQLTIYNLTALGLA